MRRSDYRQVVKIFPTFLARVFVRCSEINSDVLHHESVKTNTAQFRIKKKPETEK